MNADKFGLKLQDVRLSFVCSNFSMHQIQCQFHEAHLQSKIEFKRCRIRFYLHYQCFQMHEGTDMYFICSVCAGILQVQNDEKKT